MLYQLARTRAEKHAAPAHLGDKANKVDMATNSDRVDRVGEGARPTVFDNVINASAVGLVKDQSAATN